MLPKNRPTVVIAPSADVAESCGFIATNTIPRNIELENIILDAPITFSASFCFLAYISASESCMRL